GYENSVITCAHRERLPHGKLQHRCEHEPQRDRRQIVPKLSQDVADAAHREHYPYVYDAVAYRIAAKYAEAQYAGVEIRIGYAQEIYEQPHHREIEDQKHYVPDVHAGHEAPEQLRALVDQSGARKHAVDHDRRNHYRGDGARWNTQRHHRNKSARGGCVVRRFGAGHAFDRSLPEPLRILGQPALDTVGDEGGNNVRRAGNDADQESENTAPPDRTHR